MSACAYTYEIACAQGPAGVPGWSPVFALESTGARTVLKIVDWLGVGVGENKPETGYVGALGIVETAAEAQNITPIQPGAFLSALQLFANDENATEAGLSRGEWYIVSPQSDVLPAGVVKRNLYGTGPLSLDPFGLPLFSSVEDAINIGGLSQGDFFVLDNESDVLNGVPIKIL